jgi:hypothetical protein
MVVFSLMVWSGYAIKIHSGGEGGTYKMLIFCLQGGAKLTKM